MIRDALDGKIDLIVTKSVSRFARNTVDSLTTIRKLKDAGCECYFEKENIWTFDGKGELLLTIMSSLAQEESRSISENVTWGQRKRFADGKVSMPYKQFLGYEKALTGSRKSCRSRRDRPLHLRSFHERENNHRHRQAAHRRGHSHTGWQREVGRQNGGEYPDQ